MVGGYEVTGEVRERKGGGGKVGRKEGRKKGRKKGRKEGRTVGMDE